MNILAFDTCFSACSVAAGCGVGGASERLEAFFEPRDTGHAEALMPMIDAALRAAGIGFQDIDRVGVTIGPGSFTGTRIGVSTARALALATGIPLVGVTSLAVMAEDAIDQIGIDATTGGRLSDAPPIAVTVDARRGQVYAQLFGRSGLEALTPAQVLDVAAAARLGGEGPIAFAGSGAETVAAAARMAGRTASAHLPRLQPDASSLVTLAATLPPQQGALVPLYLREADAKPPADMSIERVLRQ